MPRAKRRPAGAKLAAVPSEPESAHSDTRSEPIKRVRCGIEVIETDEGQTIDATLKALSVAENLYQRGGRLVAITREPVPPGAKDRVRQVGPRITELSRFALHEIIARHCQFYTRDERDKKRPVQIPKNLPSLLLEKPEYPPELIKPLMGLANAPVLHSDGSVFTGPGWDPQSGIVVTNALDVEMPEQPTRDDATAAVTTLRDGLKDFPFADGAHFSAWLSLSLTLVARHLVDGCVPLFAVDANTRGSGKGLLCDVAGIIALGHPLSRATEPTNNSETRKVLTTIALAGISAVLFDNVEHTLDAPQLAAALTAEIWNDRLLGANKDVSVPWRTVLLATGNNLSFSSDLIRRVVHIRLESPLENPEERTDVEHSDLRAYVRQHRVELLGAVLTVLQAWLRAGMPSQKVTPWGSFEGWSRTVRECIIWLGLPDPAQTRHELARTGDNETGALGVLLAAIEEADTDGTGLTGAEIIELKDDVLRFVELEDALGKLCPQAPGKPITAQTLGYRLRKLRGRVVGGRALDSSKSMHGARWFVRRFAPAGG